MDKIVKTVMLSLMILNGLLFISNIYVLGNNEAAINMHTDLAPSASTLMVNAKVIICFIVGMLYLVSAFGIIRRKFNLALAGIIGFILFDGFYIIELALWSRIHPQVWFGFIIAGGLSLLIGLYSFQNWRKGHSLQT